MEEGCQHLLGTWLLQRNSVCRVSTLVDRFQKLCPPDALPASTWRPLWAWPVLNQGAKCKIYFQFHLPSTPGELELAQRLSLVFTTDLKSSPGCDGAVPERQLLTQLETFPTEERCMEKAEHKRQNTHTEQSAETVMNPCLKSRL